MNLYRTMRVVLSLTVIVVLLPWSFSFAQTNSCKEGDTNHDGRVTLTDFETWRRVFRGGVTPSMTPTPPTNQSPSGEAMPVGNLPQFRQIYTEDFTVDAPLGSFPQAKYSSKFTYYPDGTADTAGGAGKPSMYYTTKVASVTGGVLKLHLHQENGTNLVSALVPTASGQLYGKYTIRYRVANHEQGIGFKQEWVLWPQSDLFPQDGALNIETEFGSTITGKVIYPQAPSSSLRYDVHQTGTSVNAWHTASIEWTPGKAEFTIDGVSKGVSTANVPNQPLVWIIQTASCAASCPQPGANADVEIDWLTIYAYQP